MAHKRKRTAQDVPSIVPIIKKKQKTRDKTLAEPTSTPSTLDDSPFTSDPRGAELSREVQLYDLLSSEDVSERLKAASAIIAGLLGGEGVDESILQRHLERRLFRGLASGRKGARLGFSVVLTELLRDMLGKKNLSMKKYKGLTFEKLLGLLLAKTKPDGDLSGQEEKDHHLGLLFGLQSFVKAEILFGDDKSWETVLDKLLELSKKKPWIRAECGWVVVEALGQMNESQARFTLDQLSEAGLAVSPEGVGIWLTVRKTFPEMKFPSLPWGKNGNPLENLQVLAKALKESSSSDAGVTNTQQAKQSGIWNPKLHFVWDLVLDQFCETQEREDEGTVPEFDNFWKVAVDENLFSATASRERKYWGFLLFQKLLQDPQSYSKLFPGIFSHNLIRCLINHVQHEDRFLNRAADKSLKILTNMVESHTEQLVTVLPCLIGGHGVYNFDKVTKTKTIDKLLGCVNSNNASAVIKIILEPAQSVKGSENEKEAEVRRQVLGDYILNIIRKTNISDTTADFSWIKKDALPVLANIAYSKDKKFRPALSEKVRTLFRNRLMSAFTHLLTDLKAFSYTCDLLEGTKPTSVEMDEKIAEVKDSSIQTMGKLVKKIKKAGDVEKPSLQALALLYSLVIFQLYNGESEALSILDELKLCYDKLIRHKNDEDSDIDASEVLVELLLSFVSKPSALLRKVTEHVFGAFMADLTEGGLKLMTDVLESDESLRGQQQLFDQEPQDGDDVDGNSDDEEMDSDVEVVDMNVDERSLHGGLESSESDAEDSDDNDGEDEDAQKLDEALAQALRTHRPDDLQEEIDSDADMTDSEMMALDSKLVEIFKQLKKAPNKKQDQKDAKGNMVNFKARILDLLEAYVKKQASSPLAFGLLLPLLQCIRTTKTRSLAEKSHGVITAFAKAFKNTKGAEGGVKVSNQVKLVQAIHLEASKDPSHLYARASSTASLLVASSAYRIDKGSVKKIAGVYRDSQVSWVEGSLKLQAGFFVEWVNWCQSHANSSA